MPVEAHRTAEKVPAIAAADVERYVKMRARLVAASEALARATSAESAAAATGSALLALTGAQHAAVFFRSVNGVVTCPWYHHLSESYVRELITPDGVNPWVHLVRHPELACMDLPRGGRKRSPAPWLLPDVYELPVRYTVRQRVLREGMRSICSWPLSRGDRTIGAVAYYFDTPHISSEPEQEILRVFASQAAMAVENGITARTARALERSTTKAEVSTQPPVRIRTGVEAEAIRLAETLRAQELAIERPTVADGGAPLPAEYRRLADVQATLSAETERLAALQRALRSETQQLADARQALNAEAAKAADIRTELGAETARLADAREHLNAERTRLQDLQTKLEAAETALSRDRQGLENEAARITTARQELEAARTQLHEADTAHTDLAVSEQRRLADARQAVEEEQTRFAAIQREFEMQKAHLAQERAALSAERASFAAAQASHTLETDRLAQAQRQLEDERAQFTETHKASEPSQRQLAAERASVQAESRRLADAQRALQSETQQLADARQALDAERTRLQDLQTKLEAAETTLSRGRQTLETEAARVTTARQELEAARTQLHEADTAQTDLAVSEQRRLADARRAVEEEQTRLAALQREFEMHDAHLAQERAALSAERASFAAAQASHTLETDRLAQAQRRLEDERAKASETHKTAEAAQRQLAAERASLQAESQRLADAQRALQSETQQLADARQALTAEAAKAADIRTELTAEAARLADAREHLNGERTRLQDLQAKLEAAETLSRDRQTLETEAARITAARQELEEHHAPVLDAHMDTEDHWRSSPAVVPAPKPAEATYTTLVQRIGAPEAEDDDRQIAAVADLLDARNGHAEGFSKCLVGWVEALAHEFSCPEADVQALRRAALLHGIGTINVPESTLQKPSGLTADEQAMLRKQPHVAFRALNDIEWLRPAAAILRRRFERWDGTGDPDRLKGDAIPLVARILAVVDAYAAMVMGRPGIPIRPYREAITALKRGAGTHFDPAVIGAFCRIVTRARVGRVATHDAVVELLKDVAANTRRFTPANREDEVLQNTP